MATSASSDIRERPTALPDDGGVSGTKYVSITQQACEGTKYVILDTLINELSVIGR